MADDMFGAIVPIGGSLVTKAVDSVLHDYDFVEDISVDAIEDVIKATQKIYEAVSDDDDEDGESKKDKILGALGDALPTMLSVWSVPAKNATNLFNAVKGYVGDIKVGDFAHDIEDYTSGNKSFYSYGDLASYITTGDAEKEQKLLDYYSANGKEISKGSLTQEIKPAYVQMYVDSPEKSKVIKAKLIRDYEYAEDTITDWIFDEYVSNIVSNPEYAAEIKKAVERNNKWGNEYITKEIKSRYKKIYKEENENNIKAMRNALLNDAEVPIDFIRFWEEDADEEMDAARADREDALKRLE